MRVLFLSSASVFSGGDKHLVELVRRLDLSAVRPTILCFGTDPFSRVLNDRLGLGILVKTGVSRTSFFRTWVEFRRNKPDVIAFVTGNIGAFPWYQFLAARLSGAKRVCAIYHSFSEVPEPVTQNRRWLSSLARRAFGYRARFMLGARMVGALTHRSICVSNNLQQLLVESFGFPLDGTVTVRNGVDTRYYGAPDEHAKSVRRDLGIGRADVVVVAACRLVPLKGVDVLLRAVNALHDEVPNLKCVIVGEGPSEPDLRRACAEMGLSSRVFFVGFKDNVRAYLQAGDIFVNSSSASYIECFPLAVLEAMACGVPCIGSNVGGVPEIISDQEDGLLVAPGSVGELRAAIKRLALDSAERKHMGDRARQKIQLQFDIERSMEQIKSILLREDNAELGPMLSQSSGGV
jgi:glycosyltransferase involved in cell wall biosynthesis